ncbi:GNAT family N-acetyltransferase [Vagococcus sp.]|uniref:GNAT family N-acetyltransferase n=1 Tax=Vagococcus sp. TaxID=1933889 RepID=UPI003F9E3E9B
MLLFRKPTLKDKKVLLAQKKKAQLHQDIMHGDCGLSQAKDFEAWLRRASKQAFFLISKQDQSVIGIIHLKFKLTAYDALEGGHIAYTIFPDYRKLGYGTYSFSWALNLLKQKKITNILISCREGNLTSEKIILKNKGQLMYRKKVNQHIIKHYRIQND